MKLTIQWLMILSGERAKAVVLLRRLVLIPMSRSLTSRNFVLFLEREAVALIEGKLLSVESLLLV